jgi:hypothetical protein
MLWHACGKSDASAQSFVMLNLHGAIACGTAIALLLAIWEIMFAKNGNYFSKIIAKIWSGGCQAAQWQLY